MSIIQKTLSVSAPVTPYSTDDTYPTHYSIYGKGGIKSVQSVSARNSIPSERREEGMLCYVSGEQKIYCLRGGITNSSWVDASEIFGGGNNESSGAIEVSATAPSNPSASTIWFDPTNLKIYTRNLNNTQWVQYLPDSGNFVSINKNETIYGAKVFAQGPYGTPVALSGSNIDLSGGNVFTKTISAAVEFSISGVPSGKTATFNLILKNGGSKTVTWPSSVKWADSEVPDLTQSGIDVLTFLTPDGGTTWYGTVAISSVPV